MGGMNRLVSETGELTSDFEVVDGFIHQQKDILETLPGCLPLLRIAGKQIKQIYPTNDSRQNVIIQTDQGVYTYTEDELFSRVYTPSLTPITITDEENMSKAIIVHTEAPNTDSGSGVTQNTWVDAPLNAILSQLNPDGTAAAFVTALAANVFTLAAGTYRFNGWSMGSTGTTNTRFAARLYNVTAAAPAWTGLNNENGPVEVNSAANRNARCVFGGDLTIAVPTQFKVQMMSSITQATTGCGRAMDQAPGTDIALAREVYRWVEILKTA